MVHTKRMIKKMIGCRSIFDPIGLAPFNCVFVKNGVRRLEI